MSGLGPVLAGNIVRHRDAHGAFRNRRQLLEVPRLGARAFEQAAGFLRVADGDNPLDASGVHPEAYAVVERILQRLHRAVSQVIGDTPLLRGLNAADFVDARFGEPTVRDILAELEKPGRDPRPQFRTATFRDGVERLEDLQPGMTLEGVVTNVTNFGAFVDVGVHQDGLVHISALADTLRARSARRREGRRRGHGAGRVGRSRPPPHRAQHAPARRVTPPWKTAWTRSSRERSGRQRFSLS